MSQLGLFAAGATQTVATLGAPPPPPEELTLAQKLPASLRLGTMSWTFPGWIGIVYETGTREAHLAYRGLTAYGKNPLRRAVEIDRSFYEPLDAATYALYASQVPEDFRFLAKAHEECTTVRFPEHARYGNRRGLRNPRLLDVAYTVDRVVAPFAEGLGTKAGALLFQFSPFEVKSPLRFAQKLHGFLGALPKQVRYAVELRNPELLTPEYGEALKDVGAFHCFNAWGRMPGVLEQRASLRTRTPGLFVARWLTRPQDTHEEARRRYLPFNRLVEEDWVRRHELAELTAEALRAGDEALVLVCNKAEGCAPLTLARLAQAVLERQ